jgi:hypothetical protein
MSMKPGIYVLVIDPDESGFCLECMTKALIEDLREIADRDPHPARLPGRCLICRAPLSGVGRWEAKP